MAKKSASKRSTQPKAKKTKRITKPTVAGGAPFSEQDPKRRLGNFAGAGEHPRQGGRTSGIVGQTKQRGRTDKRKSK
jgi:hypothetical protein